MRNKNPIFEMRAITTMSINCKAFIFSILCFLGAKAQRTSTFYQYSISPSQTQVYVRSRVQPINSAEHYWILKPTNGIDSFKSIQMVGSSTINKTYTYDVNSYEKSPQLIFLMNKDKIIWNMIITPQNGKKEMNIINSQVVGTDIFLYCNIYADSLKIQLNQDKCSYIRVPDNSMYLLIKITKSGTCIIENSFKPLSNTLSQLQSKLIAINEKSYTVYFPIHPGYSWYKNNLDNSLINKIVADSLLTGILLQFDLGNKSVKNLMSGTFPTAQVDEINSYISTTNKLFLPGKYHGKNATFLINSPLKPAIKINDNPLIYFNKPITFSLDNTYLYWTLIDLDKWTVDETQFNLIEGNQSYWNIYNYGVLKNGYWFQTYRLSGIAADDFSPNWQNITGSLSNLFTYNSISKKFQTSGFPDYISCVEQDGDSLLFVAGGGLNLPGPTYIDFDNSDSFYYYIPNGFYCSEYTLQGKLVWARKGNFILNEHCFDRFKTYGGGKLLTSTQSYLSDLDFGFKYIRKVNVGDFSGFVIQLSKAPICDFDIENIDNNHVTINYKGALNANFYYKYGDGSKDSNMNQRFFVHDYKKTGSFILYCIAKNAYGSDTAYYGLDIWDIVSVKKLHKTNQIEISPNPSPGIVHWDIENTTSVDVFNLNGQLMQRTSTQSNNLDISTLPAQTYLVVVHTQNGSFCSKVVKAD